MEVSEFSSLTREDVERQEKISEHLGKLTVDAFEKYKPSDYTRLSEKAVNLINSYPEWDEPIVDSLEKVLESSLDRLRQEAIEKGKSHTEIESLLREQENTFQSWVTEAAVRRMVEEFGIPMINSPVLDEQGFDGVLLLKGKTQSKTGIKTIFIFASVKSSRNVSPGFYLFNPNEGENGLSYYNTEFESTTDTTHTLKDLVSNEKMFNAHKRLGRIHNAAMDEAERLKGEFLRLNPDIDPKNYEAEMMVMLAGVGVQAQEKKYGWQDLMLAMYKDKATGTNAIKNNFGHQLKRLKNDTASLDKVS